MVDQVKVLISEVNGTELEFQRELALNADNVPFDNTSNGFTSDNVQDALEEIGASASPGLSFGRAGSLSVGTWLRRVGEIPSNQTGIIVGINNPEVTRVLCSNRNVETYTIQVYEHDGNSVNLALLGSVTVTAKRGDTFSVNFPTTKNKQLAVRLSAASGTVQDLGVDLILTGSN